MTIRCSARIRSRRTWTISSRTNQDNGGVHINSGIPNRAFYLAATAIGGNAWDRAGKIWYNALLDPDIRANTDFAGFARVTVDVAGRLYGVGQRRGERAVTEAWSARWE